MEGNPQAAWEAAVRALLDAPGHKLMNLVVRIADPLLVDPFYGRSLDVALRLSREHTVHAVARTIMPWVVGRASDWASASCGFLGHVRQRHGSYFARMVDYEEDGGSVNQLARAD